MQARRRAGSVLHEAESIWRGIVARNDWRLVDDDPRFVPRVLQDLGDNADDTSMLELGLLHAYRRRLYSALRQGSGRAAEELRHTCLLRARAYGLDDEGAADASQETLRRVLEHLDDLQAPEAIVSWALTIQRSMLRDRARRASTTSLEHGLASGAITEPAEPQDVAKTVEHRIVVEQLASLLEGALRNPMERLAVQRIVLRGDKPREVARDLGLPTHQIRVHKSRALQRLRADPIFMNACEQLAIDLDGSSAAKEQTDERS